MGISFFQPIYLWAAAFVAIPVIIHLLFRKRTRTIHFSSLRFLRKTAITASKNKRLRQFLLLVTRMAIIIALVAAFAQPFLKSDPFRSLGHAQNTIYCWIDPTVSMNYRINDIMLREHSFRLIESLDSLIAPSSEILVYDTKQDDFIEIESQPDLQARHGPSDLVGMLNRYGQIQNENSGPNVLFLFSDFQARHTSILDSVLAQDTLKYPLLMVSVAPRNKQLRNAGITNPHISDVLQCSVYTQGANLTRAELQVLSGEMRVGVKQVQLAADSGKIEAIPVQNQQQSGGGQLRLQADDAFMEDNQLYFSRSSNKNKTVLVVGDEEQTLPLRTALKLLLKTRVRIEAPHTVSYEDLDSSGIIVLSGVRNTIRPLEALLAKGSLHDKLILVSPAMQPDAGEWMDNVYEHLSSKGKPVMGRSQAMYPVLPDTVSSLWRSFPRFEDRTVRISSYLENLPGSALMLMNNRKPLISWKRDGQGHVWLLWATPLEISTENNFAETGFFLPMLDRMLLFGLNRLSHQDQMWIAGQPRYNPYQGLASGADVYNSQGRLIARWENQPQVSFSLPGIYSIHPDGNPTREIAVNTDPAEFDLRYRIPTIAPHSRPFAKAVSRRQFRSFVASRSASLPSMLFWLILAGALLIETFLWAGKRRSTDR
ncbi:MAG: BatA domain-containing protein [Chitinispirillaceae bacterium]